MKLRPAGERRQPPNGELQRCSLLASAADRRIIPSFPPHDYSAPLPSTDDHRCPRLSRLPYSVARRGAVLPPLRRGHSHRPGGAAADGRDRHGRGRAGEAGAGGPLPGGAGAGRGRHGHGVPGARREAQPQGGGQGDAAGAGRHAGRRSLPARGAGGRAAQPSAHPADARLRRGRRRALLRHALRRGGDAEGAGGQGRPAVGERRDAPGPRGGGGAGVRARARHHPPRHQAWQHPAPVGACAGRGLRHRARAGRGGRGAHQDRAGRGHAAVHGAGAGHRRARGRRPGRHLRARRGDVRDGGRRAAVHGTHGPCHHHPKPDRGAALAHDFPHGPLLLPWTAPS